LGLDKIARGKKCCATYKDPDYWDEHQETNREIVLEYRRKSVGDVHLSNALLGLRKLVVVIGYLFGGERKHGSDYCNRDSKEKEYDYGKHPSVSGFC
jgi:hypothetical protein